MARVLAPGGDPIARDIRGVLGVARGAAGDGAVPLPEGEEVDRLAECRGARECPHARRPVAGEERVDDGLVHAVPAVLVEGRRYHQEDLGARAHVPERVDHRGIVAWKLGVVRPPVLEFRVICPQHEHNYGNYGFAWTRAPVLEKFDMEILPAHVHSGSAVVIALQSYAEDNGIGVSDDNSDNNAHFDVVCPPQPSMVMVRDGIIEVMEAQDDRDDPTRWWRTHPRL